MKNSPAHLINDYNITTDSIECVLIYVEGFLWLICIGDLVDLVFRLTVQLNTLVFWLQNLATMLNDIWG